MSEADQNLFASSTNRSLIEADENIRDLAGNKLDRKPESVPQILALNNWNTNTYSTNGKMNYSVRFRKPGSDAPSELVSIEVLQSGTKQCEFKWMTGEFDSRILHLLKTNQSLKQESGNLLFEVCFTNSVAQAPVISFMMGWSNEGYSNIRKRNGRVYELALVRDPQDSGDRTKWRAQTTFEQFTNSMGNIFWSTNTNSRPSNAQKKIFMQVKAVRDGEGVDLDPSTAPYYKYSTSKYTNVETFSQIYAFGIDGLAPRIRRMQAESAGHCYTFNTSSSGLYYINQRHCKLKIFFDEDHIDISAPPNVDIIAVENKHFIPIPFSGPGFVNGWSNANSSLPVYTCEVDFGENWTNLQNGSYRVEISASDTAGNSGHENKNILFDTQSPTLEFLNSLSKLSFNLLEGNDLGKFSFKLWDNLSEQLIVHFKLKKDDGSDALSADFKLHIRPDLEIIPLSGSVSDLFEIKEKNGTNYLQFKWNGKDVLGMLQTALKNPKIEIAIEDEAGNVFNSSEFKFDLKQILPDPKEVAQKVADMIKDKANKIVFVDSSTVPAWAWELVQTRLSEEGVDFRVCQLRGGDKFESLDKQAAEIKRTVDDFIRGNDKAILFGFGSGGIACKEYIRLHYSDGKVMKFTSFSMPNYGINSLAQSPESYSIYLTLSPLLSWLSSLDFLQEALNTIDVGGGLGFMDMAQYPYQFFQIPA